MKLTLGISPCPNDTFAFHGLLTGRVHAPGLEFVFEMADIQALNERLAAGRYDAAKASFHAALGLADEMVVLETGSALGYGVGPVLVARRGAPALAQARVLLPGRATTASLLYQLFHEGEGRLEQVVFSEIFPRLERCEADYGVCVHEGRFTYREHGLDLIEDLGETWERTSGGPLPLGMILARRSLGADVLEQLDSAIGASLEYARAHRDEALVTMRAHAQELADDVLWAHVDLYVNEWTRALGAQGRAALTALSQLARARGLVPPGAQALEVRTAPHQ